MRYRMLFVLAITLAMVVVSGSAFAAIAPDTTEYTTAVECLECHGASGAAVGKVDFSASTVDYAKCNACHGYGIMPDVRHYHFGWTVGECTAKCHNGQIRFALTLPADAFVYSGLRAPTAYGYFAFPDSLQTPPARLHEIHSTLDWVQRTWGDTNFGTGKTKCSPCHAVAACSACHGSTTPHTDHAASQYPGVSVRQARGDSVTYAPSTCINPSCHDLANAGTPAFTPACGPCHEPQTGAHGYVDVDHVASSSGWGDYQCADCHTLDLATEHGDPNAIGASCPSCHPSPRDQLVDTWDQGCVTGACHSGVSIHEDQTAAHLLTSTADPCMECHVGATLDGIHTAATDEGSGRASCLVCHVANSPASSDCTTCHFTVAEHYDPGLHTTSSLLVGCGGEGCHTSRDLMTVHEEKNPAFGCAGCHKDFSVALQITNGLTGCGDCHDNVATGHRSVHWASPLLQDAGGPHYSYYTGSAGGTPTGDCAGCHTSNLLDEHMGLIDPEMGYQILPPQRDSAGNALTCETCHASTDEQVLGAIAGSGLTACEKCHVVHGPIQDVHQSTFVDSPELPCGGCHSADLTVVHDGTYTSGAGLTGCDVCHALYSGQLGAAVQEAISVSNDTRCTACHPEYHMVTPSHTATLAASIGCGRCHQRGATTVDVATIHGGKAGCVLCHGGTGRITDITIHTAECASCHITQGVDFHPNFAVDHRSPVSTYETCSGCHHSWGSNPLQGHDVTRHAGGCLTCHNEAIDLTGKTALCSSCHVVEGQGEAPQSFHRQTNEFHTATDDFSVSCADCHETTNLRELHVTEGCDTCHQSLCSDCHRPHNGMGGSLLQGASCARIGCHPVEGTDFHASVPAVHTFASMPASCTEGAGCHQANTLPEEHTIHAQDLGYEFSCQLCHWSIDPARIPVDATADCASCHTIDPGHGDPPPLVSRLTGRVTRSTDGAPVHNASVTLSGAGTTSGPDGSYSYSGLLAGSYEMTVSAPGYATWSDTVYITQGLDAIQNVALVPVPSNLARAGTASASYEYSSYPSANAIDGNTLTFWRSPYLDLQWLAVDLGATRQVNQAVVLWNSTRYAKAYSIETSMDGLSWSTQYSTTAGTLGRATITFPAVSARYVRINCTLRASSDCRISEFEVWGY